MQGPGHDLPRRPAAGEGGDRRGRDAPKSSAAPRCTRASRASPTTRAERRACARARARASSRNLNCRKQACDLDAARAARAALRRRGALRHHSRRHAQALRRARDHRPHRRRLRVRRVQAHYGTTLVTGFAHIHGYPVGDPRQQRHPVLRVGAQGRALHRARRAARHPARSSCRTSPASWSARSTRRAASPRTARRWSPRWRRAQVPKFTVILGGSFGAGNYGMCGRAYSARASCGCGRTRASRSWAASRRRSVLATVRRDGIEAGRNGRRGRRFKAPIREQYERQGHPYYSSARLWDDGVVDPADSRAACWASRSPPRSTRRSRRHASACSGCERTPRHASSGSATGRIRL